jgi:acetolactate synthase-1/2/3 large subunit
VLIDVPVDVQERLAAFAYPESVNIRGYKPRQEGHPLQVKRLAEAIGRAERPLLCFGGGVFLSGAEDTLLRFVEETGIPAVSTMMGLGGLPHDDALYLGMVGQSGSLTANRAVDSSDMLILLGARVGDRAIVRPAALAGGEIAHIDIDTAEIGKNLGTTIPLVGDAGRVLEQLMEKPPKGDWDEWRSGLQTARRKEQEDADAAVNGHIPEEVVRQLCRRLPQGSAYVADVGQNQLWSAKNYAMRGRFLTTGGMGTMGYSLPAAIGAKLARPELEVVAVCGDGAFQMCMAELSTALSHKAPVKVVVMRNDSLGLVREIQRNQNSREFAVELKHSPDLRLLASAYGVEYSRIDKKSGVEPEIERMLAYKGVYILEVDCTKL